MYLSDTAFQYQVLLLSVGFGTLLGLVYDCFRLIRLISGDRKHGVFLQDLLYFVLAAFLTVLFLLVVNHGSLRLYILLAMAVGFSAYYLTLSRFILSFGQLLLARIRSMLRFLARVTCAPLRLVLLIFASLKRKITKIPKNHKKQT